MKFLLFTVAVFLGIFFVQGQVVIPDTDGVGYGICTLWGDVHYITFDNATFNYQGICKYEVASYCGQDRTRMPFRIYAEQEYRYSDTSVSYLKYLEIHYDNHIIQLGPGLVATVDGLPVTLPYSTIPSFTIYVTGGYIIFAPTGYNQGPTVEFDGNFQAYIIVSKMYMNSVCGVCGNFDADTPNDYRKKNGNDVSSDPNPGRLIGDSWADNIDCPIVNHTEDDSPTCPNTNKPCWIELCRELADLSGVYGSSVHQLPAGVVNMLVSSCILDACFTSGESIPRSILHFLHYANALNPACTSCPTTLNGFPIGYTLVQPNDAICSCSPPYSNTMYVPKCGYWCDCIGKCDGYGALYECWGLYVADRCLWLWDPLSAHCTAVSPLST